MVDQIITKEGLINASKDANTLEECINGPANKKVRSRLGGHYWTLATVGSIVEETKTETSEFLNDLATRYLALSLKGDWQAATAYVVKDLVFVENITYICLVGHTSSSSFQSDLNNGKWFVYQGATQVDLQNYTPLRKDYPKALGERSIRFDLVHSKGAMRYGLSDAKPLDDLERNFFRGLVNKDAWAEENIGIGSNAGGRNNCAPAYLSDAGYGHDSIAYGIASTTVGVACCTGNPDEPINGTDWGYGSFAGGRNSWARGKKAFAFGEFSDALSRYCIVMGYKAIAGPSLPTHPDYVSDGAEGAAAQAHGYQVEAYGNFAVAFGAFLEAYNGAMVIGKGINDGSPLIVSKRGLAFGYNVDIPTIFCKEGPGVNGGKAWVGFNTDVPRSLYWLGMGESDTVTHVIDSTSGLGAAAFETKGLLSNGEYGSLHNIIITHPNAGQAYGAVTYYLNGQAYLAVTQDRKAHFYGVVSATAGVHVGGKQILGNQMPAIANSNGTTEDNTRVNNAILAALRAHGLIAT